MSVPNLTNEMKVREMNDKYVKLADVKRKLRYIFKAYGVGGFVREKVERALNNLPHSVKGDLETTLKATDVQPVKHGRWIITDDVEHFIAICSECGRTEDSRGIKDMPYCHCGARMDGEQNE